MFRPDTRHLATIYRSLGTTYDERVLPSIGNEVLKATVAQFDAAELITQREVVSARIRQDLLKRAGEFNIILEDVSLVRVPTCCLSPHLRVLTKAFFVFARALFRPT